MNPKLEEMMKKAEDYIQAIRNFDLVVTEEGTRRIFSEPNGLPLGPGSGKEVVERTYSEWLGHRMTSVEIWKTDASDVREDNLAMAIHLLMSEINRGLTGGFLRQGQGLVAKWENSEKDNRELRRRQTELEQQLLDCASKATALDKHNKELDKENKELRRRRGIVSLATESGSVEDR